MESADALCAKIIRERREIEDAYNHVIELKLQVIHLMAKIEQLEREHGTEAPELPEVWKGTTDSGEGT
jgi:hypothetical protein